MLASPETFARTPHFSLLASPPRFLHECTVSVTAVRLLLRVMQVAVDAYLLAMASWVSDGSFSGAAGAMMTSLRWKIRSKKYK